MPSPRYAVRVKSAWVLLPRTMKSGAEVLAAGVRCVPFSIRALFLGGIFAMFFFDTLVKALLFAVGFLAAFFSRALLAIAKQKWI